ncbi:MAG TPA: FHA domain-containing protein [Pirellulales bacterium]|nr:FHA domain-containing protein [Pirellulales bacterium]
MALLLSLNGPNPGQRYLIPKGCAVLGRDADCEIVLGFSAVSRRHAQITLIDDDYYIEDLQSRNGTFVNGEAVRVM